MKNIFIKKLIFILIIFPCFIFTGTNDVNAAPKYSSFSLDARSGEIVHNNKGFQKRYPASLTKVMTLYLIFEDINNNKIKKTDLITFSRNASSKPASKLGLSTGETISFSNAIKALAIKSANDVATAVAEHISGSEKQFALKMTEKARELGMYSTTFKNASGLHDNYQTTTAYDMAILGLRMIKDYPEESKVFSIKEFSYEGKKYSSHNRLLYTYNGAKGIKTGFTSMSGFNLLTYVTRSNKQLISVVMGGSTSNSRNSNMAKVLDLSLKKTGGNIPYPIMNPYSVSDLKNQKIDYSLNHKQSISSSKYDILSNRVNKFLAILP
ncbi:MAG: D-alanyl-D-alanine carboxypeptidase [Hyphomicrobiales bacterium]|nr:D-alanyl-D-alanine carboxypeptidase [Hyphomicrobiales bacterium]